MNCKPGDLAFIVGSAFPENIGRIAQVITLLSGWQEPSWLIRVAHSPIQTNQGPFMECGCFDSHLRPIRPEPELLPAPPVAVTA